MTVQTYVNAFPTFTGLDGLPLSGGYVYFGEPNQDAQQYPKAVFWDEAMTSPATQPLRTSAGFVVRNGSPANVWADGSCSVLVLDSNNRQVFYMADWSGIIANVTAAATAAGAASAAAAAASASDAATSATNAAASATSAATQATNAQTYANASASSAKFFDTIALGLAGVVDGATFGVKAGGSDALIRPTVYRRDSAATKTLLYEVVPSGEFLGVEADMVRNQIAIGDYTARQTTATYGSTTPDTGTLGAGIHANVALTTQSPGLLKSVAIRVSAAGSGEVHVYKQVDGTHWTVTDVIPVTFSGAGVGTFTAGDGILPKGIRVYANGFLGFKHSGIMRFSAGGSFNTISGDTGVGSTVTVSSGAATLAMQYVLETVTATLDGRITPLETFKTSAANPTAWAKVVSDALASLKTTETVGQTTSGATGVSAGNYTGDETVTSVSGVLTSLSAGVSGAGSAEFHVYAPSDATHWTCTDVIPVTFTGAGVQSFTAGVDFADNIVVKQGGRVSLKTFGGLLLMSGTSLDTVGERPAKYLDVTGDAGVGSTVTMGGGAAFDPRISYTLQTVDIAAILQAKVNAALTYSGQNYSLSPLLAASKAYFIGDSTVAFFNTRASLSSRIGSVRTLIDVANPGDTIANQKTKWLALTITPSQVGYVYIQIGLNNIDGNAANTATIIAALQDLVNTVRTSIGSDKKIIIGTMTPAKQRWIDVFGAGVGATAQTQWSDINTAITGGGGSPITGVDARVSSHSTDMSDGTGNLASYYDTGDHIHPLNGGRNVNAAAIKAGLNTLGMVP